MSIRRGLVLVFVLAPVTLFVTACFQPPPWPQVTPTTTTTTTTTAPPVLCATGSFNAATGNEPCTPAPPGFFVDVVGATQATPCSLGRFQPSAGQASCLQAPIGTYVDVIGASAATLCPALTTTAGVGSASLADCVGIVPATLVFSNAQDIEMPSNFGYLNGAGLAPGSPVDACADQFPCQFTGLSASAGGVISNIGPLFPALPCKTNIYFTGTTAIGTPITSNTLSYPPGTPGCP